MSNSKKNIVIDLKNNYNEKNVLIEDLKELIHSSVSNAEKIKSFNSIREKWIKIGKVPTHLSFGLNNSYKHHVKIFYDFLYLDKKIKKKDQNNNKKLMISILNDAPVSDGHSLSHVHTSQHIIFKFPEVFKSRYPSLPPQKKHPASKIDIAHTFFTPVGRCLLHGLPNELTLQPCRVTCIQR